MKKENAVIISAVTFSCAVMALTDGVIKPGYWVKSSVKLVLFLLIPILYSLYDRNVSLTRLFRFEKKSLLFALTVGAAVFAVILGGYFMLRNYYDFSAIVDSLTVNVGVGRDNFIYVALYIAAVNSLLEEFFFRGFAFLTLRKYSSRRIAYIFSSCAFALYHVAMMTGWFSPLLWILALAGLICGGLIFDYFNEKSGTVYPSWLIHMFANLAINTVGIILIYN